MFHKFEVKYPVSAAITPILPCCEKQLFCMHDGGSEGLIVGLLYAPHIIPIFFTLGQLFGGAILMHRRSE